MALNDKVEPMAKFCYIHNCKFLVVHTWPHIEMLSQPKTSTIYPQCNNVAGQWNIASNKLSQDKDSSGDKVVANRGESKHTRYQSGEIASTRDSKHER